MPGPATTHSLSATVGRYVIYDPIASGGMATVCFARQQGPEGFARTVAVKRLRDDAQDLELSRALIDEARLVSRVSHPNVVPVLDVVHEASELLIVLAYVHGDTLSGILRALAEEPIPPRVLSAIFAGALHGLHAAHEASDEEGRALGLVHRDVSPQNILVGVDGIARVLDFGIAKALGRTQVTREGQVKGKLRYMAPEQLYGEEVTRRTDLFALSAVMWEALTRRPLFAGGTESETIGRLTSMKIEAPGKVAPHVPRELDAIVLKGLSREPSERYPSALAMALAIERVIEPAPASEVGRWVERVAVQTLDARARVLKRIERTSKVAASTSMPVIAMQTRASGSARRARPGWLVVSVIAGVLALMLSFSAWWPRTPEAPFSPSSRTPTAAVPEPVVTEDPPTSGPAAERPLNASESPPVAASKPAQRSEKRPRRGQSVAGSTKPEGCDPPYTVDAQGHKHFRVECL